MGTGALLEDLALAGATLVDARSTGTPPLTVRRIRATTPASTGVLIWATSTVDISDALILLDGSTFTAPST